MSCPDDEHIENRARLKEDPHYPQYHFLPPANWMNDPNGLIQWKGQYHLFYQHNPNGAFWGDMHWGHAVSEDMVHWSHLPIALAPEPGGPDKDGCFSGCAVVDGGTPTLVYTGVLPERPCLATSTDDLLTWDKYGGNPVISSPPAGLDVVGFRDHSVWKEGGTWYQVIGSGIRGVGGTVLLYKSPDLIRWEYLNPLLIGDKERTDPFSTSTMWECPDFFPLDGTQILVFSVCDSDNCRPLWTAYFSGTYADHRFSPAILDKVDFGDSFFYAPQTLVDDRGRRIMWGWIKEGRSDEAQREAGWAGVMSLPRVLSLGADGRLKMAPADELKRLRGRHFCYEDAVVGPGPCALLRGIRGDCLEIRGRFEPGDAEEYGLNLRCSPDGQEQTVVSYNRASRRLSIDGRRASLCSDVCREVHEAPLDLGVEEALDLHVYLDRSVVEVFANDRVCITARVYPARQDSLELSLYATGGHVDLSRLDIWEVNSIWKRE